MAAKDQDAGMVPRDGNSVCTLRNQRGAGRDRVTVRGVRDGDMARRVMRRAHRSQEWRDLGALLDGIGTTLAETAAFTGIDDARRLTAVS